MMLMNLVSVLPLQGGRDSPGPELAADMPGATFGGPAGRMYSYDELARATQVCLCRTIRIGHCLYRSSA
jgi:hypothetical protein